MITTGSLRATAATLLMLATACNTPIELADDGVVELTGQLPFGADDLPASARETLRVTAELTGATADTPLSLDESGGFRGALIYDIGDNEGDTADLPLVVRVEGALDAAERPVLLARFETTLSLRADDRVEVTVDTFDDGGADPALIFDVNRNGEGNLADLKAGCSPGVSASALALSATDLQFPSGTVPGEAAKQVVVLDNLGADDVTWSARVVGGPGMNIGPLDVDDLLGAPIGRELNTDTPESLSSGDETLVVVTYTPVDSRYSTGFLVVESLESRCNLRRSASVRLIGNPDGEPSSPPLDLAAAPAASALGLELDVAEVPDSELFGGDRPLTVSGIAAADDAVTVGGVLARAAALVRVPASTRLDVALVGLSQDADLELFPVSADTVGEALGVSAPDAVHPGTDVETATLPPADAEQVFLIVVVEADVADAPASERFDLFLRASAFPTLRRDDPISPFVGAVDGGTPVTISGAGFLSGATVTFAGRPARDVVVNAAGTEITAATPSGTLAVGFNPADLVVRNPAQPGLEAQVAMRPAAFVYSPLTPEIIALNPSTVAVMDGNETITLRGSGLTEFFGPIEVEVDGVPASDVVSIDETRLTFTPPARSTPGVVSVLVRVPTLDGTQEDVASDAFTYVDNSGVTPTLTALDPVSGPASTATVIAVTGADFIDGATLLFGSQPALAVTFNDAGSLTAVSPALAPGSYDVVVRNPDGARSPETITYTAFASGAGDALVSFVDPDPVHALVAGDVLRVLGQNLAAATLSSVNVTDGTSDYASTALGAVSAFVSLQIDQALPVGDAYRVELNYAGSSDPVVSPTFSARAPEIYAGQVVSGVPLEGQAFTFLLTGERLFGARVTGVRFDGPETLTLTPDAATETSVRVSVTSLQQGSYDVTLVYPGGVEVTRAGALTVTGDCGNGAREGTEECDLADLDGESCSTLGFVGGGLTCNSDCTFNLSTCNGCGNGVLDSGEQCDGTDLGGNDCGTYGYDDGTLACTTACSLDVSACSSCGDGLATAGEACDNADLRGATCSSLGFDDGLLTCLPTCGAVDTRGCETCGDGVCSGSETNATCGQDCLATCNDGNDTCDGGEGCSVCPTDCDVCGGLSATVIGGGQSSAIGLTFGQPITVTVVDMNGTPVPGVVITFEHPPGGRAVGTNGDNTSLTSDVGIATATITPGLRVGNITVTVTGVGPGGALIDGLPAALSFTAEDVAPGTILPVLNVNRVGTTTIDPSGSARVSSMYQPYGIALADDGGVYVTALLGHKVFHIDPDGRATWVAGDGDTDMDGEGVPAREGGLHEPVAVTADGVGGLYVFCANAGAAGRIRHISAAGVLTTFGGAFVGGAPPNEGDGLAAIDANLDPVHSIARDPTTGDLYLAQGNAIRKIDALSTVVTRPLPVFGSCERGGRFDVQPSSLTVSESGEVLWGGNIGTDNCAVEAGSNRVGSLRPDGTRRAFGGPGCCGDIPTGIAIDARGDVYFGKNTTTEILRVDSFGRVTAVAGGGSVIGSYGPATEAQIRGLRNLLITPAGDLWFTDAADQMVRMVRDVVRAAPPTASLEVVSTGPFSALAMQPTPPLELLASLGGDPTGSLPVGFEIISGHTLTPSFGVTDVDGLVEVQFSAGRAAGTYSFSAGVVNRYLEVDESTRLDVDVTATAHPPGTLYVLVNGQGTAGEAIGTSGLTTQLSSATKAIATDDAGALYIADRNNERALRVGADGAVTQIAGIVGNPGLPTNGQPAAEQPVAFPTGIAAAANGSVFISAQYGSDGRIFEVDTAGVIRHRAGGGGDTGLNIPGNSADLDWTYDALAVGSRVYFGEDLLLRYLDDTFTLRAVSLDADMVNDCHEPGPITELAEMANGHLAITGWLPSCLDYNTSILEVDPDTGTVSELTAGYAFQQAQPGEVDAFAISPITGDLYFGTVDQIVRRNSDGSFTDISGTEGLQGRDLVPTPAGPNALIDNPRNMAFFPNGDLVFLEDGQTIRVLTQPDQL